MKINKQELLDALSIVRPGLANKEMIAQSTSFAFLNGRVVTYNDEISISHPVQNLDIEGAVKANELYELLNKIKKDEIDFEMTESEIRIKAGRSKAGLTLKQEVTLPLEEIGEQGKWKKLPDQFQEALKFTSFSCSNDMSMPVLTCIHVDKKTSCAISSDNFRLTYHNLGGTLPINSFLIPASSVKELIKYLITHIAEGQGWVHFKTKEDTIFSCRIFEDTYPDTSKMFNVQGNEIHLPKSMEAILERAQVFARAEHFLDEQVLIKLGDKKFTIRSEGVTGWFEETANTKYSGEEIEFYANPVFLKDICSKVQSCILSKSSMKFVGKDWEHIIALKIGK